MLRRGSVFAYAHSVQISGRDRKALELLIVTYRAEAQRLRSIHWSGGGRWSLEYVTRMHLVAWRYALGEVDKRYRRTSIRARMEPDLMRAHQLAEVQMYEEWTEATGIDAIERVPNTED